LAAQTDRHRDADGHRRDGRRKLTRMRSFACPAQSGEHQQIPEQMIAIVVRQMPGPNSPPLAARDQAVIQLQPL
jgi:hypothetical protein